MQRQSNLELLRILAMLMIVMGHCAFAVDPAFRSPTLDLLSRCGRVAVNVFLIIGCWFMTERPPDAQKIVRTYFALAVTTVSLTLLAIAMGTPAPLKDVCRGFFPFLGRPLWFVSAYLCLMAVAPCLCRVFEWEARLQRTLALGAFLGASVICTLPDPQEAYVSDVFWFGGVFLFVGWLKRRIDVLRLARRFRWGWLALGVVIYCSLVVLPRMFPVVAPVCRQWAFDIKSLPNVAAAGSFFLFFLSLDLGVCRPVNFLASGTLGVYMIHEVPAFSPCLWLKVFGLQSVHDHVEVRIVLTALAVYAVGLAYDLFRRRAIDRPVMKSGFAVRLVSFCREALYGSN